jgi:putative nucleotidyltransferase with HDIG domain
MSDRNLSRRQPLMDELLRRFGAALRGAQLYAPGHPLVARNVSTFAEVLGRLLEDLPSISIALVADEVVVGDMPVPKGALTLGELFAKLKARGIERITFDRGVDQAELVASIDALCRRLQSVGDPKDDPWPELPHVRVGLVRIEQRTQTSLADMVTIRKLYSQATDQMKTVWENAAREGLAQAQEVRTVVDDLAQVVSQNRNALLALTAIRSFDNYTFTHMVNVSILTMVQARGLGIDGTLLREFGVAGLMHDIGKVRTPPEILTKPARLDDSEMTIMRRHVVDGAEILRRTRDMTPLAAIVAFEHHLRLDGTGYPTGVARPALNLATMLTTISDVYDAMRSKRGYQEAFASERILAVLQRAEGNEFEQNLVRRFVQLMGLYPVGSLVKLNTGACAVVMRPYPPDPQRPRVRVVFAADGHRLDVPYDLNLWEIEPAPHRSSSVVGPTNGPDPTFDPLSAM